MSSFWIRHSMKIPLARPSASGNQSLYISSFFGVPLGASSAESMNSSRAGNGFAAMPASSWYEVFLSSAEWSLLVVNDQHITALHYDHVFVEIMHMRSGACGLMTGPQSHLPTVSAIEHIPPYSASH